MERKCFVNDCTSPPEMTCSCDNQLFCSHHLSKHHAAPRVHNYVPIVPASEDQSSKFVLDNLIEHLSHLSLLKTKVLTETKTLIEEISNISNSAIKRINIYEQNLISSICLLNRNLDSKNKLQDYLKDLIFQSKEKIEKEVTQFWPFPKISDEAKKFLPELENLFRIESAGLPYFLDEQKDLYFFVEDSVMLTSFCVKKMATNSFRFPLKSNRGAGGVFCYLPNSKMFYGGGSKREKTISQYMIIDEEIGEIYYIQDGVSRKQAGSCYFADSVLVFAGYDGDKALNSCQKLNVQTLKWESFADLPCASDTSVTVIYNQVYVSGGQLTGVFTYVPGQDFYLNVFDFLGKGNKFLCSGLGRMYLLYEGEVFVSEINRPWQWKKYELRGQLGKYWIASWILYKDCIYFTAGHYIEFGEKWPVARKLNLSTFEIEDIY